MNHLSRETSPYLLQHAHNPVDWYAWKPEAFERARKEGKPILVSIGYSTCHWCHVMERESFENEAVAAFMNKHFINIKVDREERPDVDQIYMEACQVISGSGGWPLNCFLTPDGRPFYASTYFPPKPKYNRPSWSQVLQNINNAFLHKRETVEDQANRLMEILNGSDNKLQDLEIEHFSDQQGFDMQYQQEIYYKIRERFDRLEGGFGATPKFPGTMTLNYLLKYYFFTKNEEAREHVLFSLDKMIQGGIYDQLGGGFARYTVDRAWLIPHFEKMLYDNALLVEVLSDAYKLTGKTLYRNAIDETLSYIAREMTHGEGGFYSAQDADSDGEEGKFYVWSKAEADQLLGADSEIFCAFYDITESGNWEGKNILRIQKSLTDFAESENIEVEKLESILSKGRKILFEARKKRIAPGLDDKVLLDWNALMCSAYANAYNATGNESYKEVAERNLNFIFQNFSQEVNNPAMFHTWKSDKAQYNAFLNDYAYLIKALLDVFTINGNFDLLEKAKTMADYVHEEFYDEKDQLYYFTGLVHKDIILRKKEIYDSSTPSGNSIMAENLFRLAVLFDEEKYRKTAHNMLNKMKGAMLTYPRSFAQWAQMALGETNIYEIAVTGGEANKLSKEIRAKYIPGAVLMMSEEAIEDYPLLKGRYQADRTLIYLCRNYTCQRPVENVGALMELL